MNTPARLHKTAAESSQSRPRFGAGDSRPARATAGADTEYRERAQELALEPSSATTITLIGTERSAVKRTSTSNSPRVLIDSSS